VANDTTITPENNGPYHVRGDFQIVLPSGRALDARGETWLCRCGGSQTKPFCDGTHAKIGFQAVEAVAVTVEGTAEATDDFQEVGAAGRIGEGELLGVDIDSQPVVIGRVAGELYAIGGICSHQFARLEDGALEGEVVVCPLHNSGFNIKTGQAVRLPATEPVERYAVRAEGGTILVSRRPLSTP
jgi:nitrite reductase/ring-hydroxylating ferredoxin subunit